MQNWTSLFTGLLAPVLALFTGFLKLLSGLFSGGLLCLMLIGCLGGCAIFKQQAPIERMAEKFVDGPIADAVKKGLLQGVESLTIQAGAQAINPTYRITAKGKYVTGIELDASVAAEGVAGQIQISSVSTEETETSPHATTGTP